ncbi:unnamed protein product [Pylaiella littoralis]
MGVTLSAWCGASQTTSCVDGLVEARPLSLSLLIVVLAYISQHLRVAIPYTKGAHVGTRCGVRQPSELRQTHLEKKRITSARRV